MFGKKRIYLDAAAGVSGNPSSPHREGREAKKRLEDARLSIARLLEVQADDVVFTSGGTEANALAIRGYFRALRRDAPFHMLYLPSAHASIVENMKRAEAEGAMIEALPIIGGRVDTEELAKKIRPETLFVSMDAVCGETGVVWNTREVADMLKKRAPHAVLHVDASQAPFTEKITRAHFGADMLTLDGSKVCEARGIGALVAHRTIPLVPLYGGGAQERGLRSGSEPFVLAEDFAAGLTRAASRREGFRQRAEEDRRFLIERLSAALPDLHINEGRRQAPNVLNISLPGRDTDYLVALLDEAGYAVSTRSACETDSEEGSRAVFALTGDVARAKATLRISWNDGLRRQDLEGFADALVRSVHFIDSA